MEKKPNELEKLRAVTLSQGCIDEKTYEFDDTFRPGAITPEGVHTTAELYALLKKDSTIGFDSIVVAGGQDKARMVRLDKKGFMEAFEKNTKRKNFKKVMESFDRGFDFQTGANIVGDDYVPLLGGPFNKQMYLHDFLRAYSLGFYNYHHDPVARAIVNITVDFTLGRGYRLDTKDEPALAKWRAFEEANDLQGKMRNIAAELVYGGESMIWWLPDGQTYVEWQDKPGQESPKASIPRIRLIDPSTVWEIITYPEDITRVIAYQQVFPTQYQIYTAEDGGSVVPSSKFVIQQIPANQVNHYKVNCASNEKRGRSDFYPAFGFMKRLRDTIQYLCIQEQKAAAWSLDTEISGSPTDIENYINDQQSQPTIPPAGSEFVHTPKIKRQYLANEMKSGGTESAAVSSCLDMVMVSVTIPTNYLGLSHAGGGTRAGALVGTEPVTKKFESRQLVMEKMLRDMYKKVTGETDCEITFPELITQDRSQKIKDTIMASEVGVISHEMMCNIIAKELGYSSYDYDTEQATIASERAAKVDAITDDLLISPLTAKPPGTPGGPPAPSASSGGPGQNGQPKSSAITGNEQAQIKKAATS